MPVQVVAGRLVGSCEISTKFRRIPVKLFLDFDRDCAFELHNKAADGIKADAEGGQKIKIHLSGFDLVVDGREHGDEDEMNLFTKLYSRELGETACVGALGARIFEKYHVTFDLSRGFVYFEAPHEKTGRPPEEVEGTVATTVTTTNHQIWIPVKLADKRILSVCLGTGREDSILDEKICEAMGKPAGDIGPVRMQSVDFHRYLAFRPAELVQVHADGALGVLGLNLLRCFRVEVDRVNRFVRFTETRKPSYPKADFQYFQALVTEEAEPVRRFLKEHPKSRLAREAAEQLLELLLDEGAPSKDFDEALEFMDQTRIEDLRCTEGLETMKTLLTARRPELAIRAGELGVKSGRKDRYPESVHKLHAKLGELLLDAGKDDGAWEHLLSAAFGLPEDGRINLDLGRFYERQKRYKRAMSRYIQAVIQPESGPLAIKGLERVQRKMGGEALSVDLVDRMISGKVYNFGAATKFEPSQETDTNRCVLVEFFTNPHLAQRLPEGWRSFNVGGAMAVEGLLSHYPRKRVALVTWFVDKPEPVALLTEAGMHTMEEYGRQEPDYMRIDGQGMAPGAGRSRDAEKIYARSRSVIQRALTRTSPFQLSVSASVAEGVVKGSVKVEGPERELVVLQVLLVERGVLYPGKGMVVVHRMVVRAPLTGDSWGVEYAPKKGVMQFPFRKGIAEVRKENEAWLASYEKRTHTNCTRLSTKLDPRQLAIVAFLRDESTGAVLQTVYGDVSGPARKASGR